MILLKIKKTIMKKITLILFTALTFYTANSQVLYDENFDNLAIGDISTDPTGIVPGKGGWYTTSVNKNRSNSYFQIINHTGKGRVMVLNAAPALNIDNNKLELKGLDVLWNKRTSGNNILKFEFELFLDSNYTDYGNAVLEPKNYISLKGNGLDHFVNYPYLANYIYHPYNYSIYGVASRGNNDWITINPNKISSTLKNVWIKLVFYIDYVNGKVIFDIPILGSRNETAYFLNNLPHPINYLNYYPTLIEIRTSNLKPPTDTFGEFKYDNFKISAINQVPSLNTNEFLAEKFNLYPNPATNVLTITNNENMLVQQVEIYEITGKQLSTQTFNNEAEIELNVENLASGTYLLYLQTTEGIAVKKLIKK